MMMGARKFLLCAIRSTSRTNFESEDFLNFVRLTTAESEFMAIGRAGRCESNFLRTILRTIDM